MKSIIYILLVAILLSGCTTKQLSEIGKISGSATKKVTKIAENRYVNSFEIKKLSSAQYYEKEDKILVRLDLKYRNEDKVNIECFYFPAYKFQKRLVLRKEYKTSCSQERGNFTYLPIATRKHVFIPKYDEYGVQQYMRAPLPFISHRGYPYYNNLLKLLKDYPGPAAIGNEGDYLYLINLQKDRKFKINIPTEKQVIYPAYALYPFSIAIDIITFPVVVSSYYFYTVFFYFVFKP